MLTYCILGTGAVGGYYGALLQSSGLDVSFLLRSDFGHVKQHGLKVESKSGNFVLKTVKAFQSYHDLPQCDVAILTWKTTENDQLSKVLPHALKPGGIVLVLQNGFDPESVAAACVPDSVIIGGLCFLASHKAGPGHIVHESYGAITFAVYPKSPAIPGEVTGKIRQIEEDFHRAGIETRWHENWSIARWSKLVWNIPFNGLCALMSKNTAQLMENNFTRILIEDLMNEVVSGARACGVLLPPDIVLRMLGNTSSMPPYNPSMKLDQELGRPMEIEAIYLRTITEIKNAGGTAPKIENLASQLMQLEGAATSPA